MLLVELLQNFVSLWEFAQEAWHQYQTENANQFSINYLI